MYTDTDKVWKKFLSACIATPNKCTLAKYALSANDLEKRLDDLFNDIKFNPVPARSHIIDYSLVKKFIMTQLYYPDSYAKLAEALEGLLVRNITLLSALTSADTPLPGSVMFESLAGIRCSDKFLRTSNVDLVRTELKDKLYPISPRFGDLATVKMSTCAQWGFVAKGGYDGNFRVKTSFPPLVIGNTWDPVTPLKSARNLSALLEGSVLLQHNGHGVSRVCNHWGDVLRSSSICQLRSRRHAQRSILRLISSTGLYQTQGRSVSLTFRYSDRLSEALNTD